MQTKETKFLVNYKPFLIGLTIHLIIFGFLLLKVKSLIPVLVVFGLLFVMTYMIFNRLSFYKICISNTAIKATPWFKQERILLNIADIEALHIHKSDSFSFAEFIVHASDKSIKERFSLSLHAYRMYGSDKSHKKITIEDKLKELISNDKLTITDENSLTNTETGSAIRWFVWFGVLVYAVKLYVDLMVLKGIHFSTMNVLPYSWIVIVVVSLLCLLNIRNRTKKNDYLTSVLVGVILGWVLTVSISTFVKWHNENSAEIVSKNYKFVLDDYDEPMNEQRWLVSEEAQALIKRERLYLDGRGRAYEMNTKLEENKTYLLPIAVGRFNDVFLPKDAFFKATLAKDSTENK